MPKSRIYRLIREGQVRVNKKRIKAETKLAIGDQISVAPIAYEQKEETAVLVTDSCLFNPLNDADNIPVLSLVGLRYTKKNNINYNKNICFYRYIYFV
ncbi:S4 domain-containing protein [Escherichia coli]|uniref:S4 domain-containing protein n=1 Tax=Escherichia coli TaxID=562 RepID=UPI00390CA7FA